MEIATIGFTKSTARHFFERLRAAGVSRVVDVRLHNVSQLAGFAKGEDLAYFSLAIINADYEHDLRLAPTDELLSGYRKGERSWDEYEATFLSLLRERDILSVLDRQVFETRKSALLCSEASPDRCHRRLVAEFLADAWDATVEHL